MIKWQTVSQDVQTFAKANGYQVRTSGQLPFRQFEVLATDDEVEEMYDHLTAACEHISCSTI